MKNKLFMVYDIENVDGFVNIVSAQNKYEAKRLGAYTDQTCFLSSWMDLRAKAIKGGMTMWYDDNGKIYYFSVKGKGFVYTDLPSGLLDFDKIFIPELISQRLYQIEDNR